MKILIDRHSDRPLHEQVRDAIKRLITDGVLVAGEELPASRVMARKLNVNRGTITTAYDDLVADGLLFRHVGKGTFVAPKKDLAEALRGGNGSSRAEVRALPWDALFAYDPLKNQDPMAPEIARWGARSGMISFSGGIPDMAMFPADEFRLALNRALREEGARLLQYGTPAGHRAFVDVLRRYLMDRGVGALPEEILIVNGSQQGIDLVARTFIGPDDPIVAEDPSYYGALNLFRTLRARILPVPVDSEGLDVAHLEKILDRERPRFLYTMPTFQNPTGYSMSLERRRRLLAVANERQLPILEDDFDGDLIYEGDNLPPLKGMPDGHHVIYTGTFSKVLFPGIRLGWVVAPQPVIERLSAAKQASDLSTSLLFQAAMVHFSRGNTLARHADMVRAEYRRRRDTLLRALEREMPPGVTWTRPAGGFSMIVRLPAPLDTSELLPRAAARGVLYTAGKVLSLTGDRRIMRLSFGNVKAEAIPEGVKRLAAVLKEELGRTGRTSGHRDTGAMVPPV